MEKEYRELKELTTSIVNIYLELAKLEKQGKRESQEYENLVLILPKALELEKRKSFILSEKDDCIATNKEIIKNATWIDNIFLQPTKEVLVAIHLLNLMDNEMYYSLLGNTSKAVQVHYYMEESFLYELVKHIYRVSASE